MYRQQRNSLQNNFETNELIKKSNEHKEDSTARYILLSDTLSKTSSDGPRISSDGINYNLVQEGEKKNTTASFTPDSEQPFKESSSML